MTSPESFPSAAPEAPEPTAEAAVDNVIHVDFQSRQRVETGAPSPEAAEVPTPAERIDEVASRVDEAATTPEGTAENGESNTPDAMKLVAERIKNMSPEELAEYTVALMRGAGSAAVEKAAAPAAESAASTVESGGSDNVPDTVKAVQEYGAVDSNPVAGLEEEMEKQSNKRKGLFAKIGNAFLKASDRLAARRQRKLDKRTAKAEMKASKAAAKEEYRQKKQEIKAAKNAELAESEAAAKAEHAEKVKEYRENARIKREAAEQRKQERTERKATEKAARKEARAERNDKIRAKGRETIANGVESTKKAGRAAAEYAAAGASYAVEGAKAAGRFTAEGVRNYADAMYNPTRGRNGEQFTEDGGQLSLMDTEGNVNPTLVNEAPAETPDTTPLAEQPIYTNVPGLGNEAQTPTAETAELPLDFSNSQPELQWHTPGQSDRPVPEQNFDAPAPTPAPAETAEK